MSGNKAVKLVEESTVRRDIFHQQLPRYTKLGWLGWLGIFGSLASLASLLIFEILVIPDGYTENIYAVFVCISIVLLLALVIKHKVDKRYLYSEIIQHIHFVNHTCRDFLSNEGMQNPDTLKTILTQVSDAISESFSIVHRKKCHVSLKVLHYGKNQDGNKNLYVTVYAEDSVSQNRKGSNFNESSLAENYSSVWSFIDADSDQFNQRYYVRSNLMTAYLKHDYTHPELKLAKENSAMKDPTHGHFLWLYFPNWPLLIKSTLVLPIRYLLGGKPKGCIAFLCIDSESRNMFLKSYSKELAAAYADALYPVLSLAEKKDLIIV